LRSSRKGGEQGSRGGNGGEGGNLGELYKLADKLVKEAVMNVDPLNGAAALSRVEEGPVNKLLNRVVKVTVGPHISGVLSSKLKSSG